MRELLPVVLFLVTILVVSDVCARAGLFAAAARLVGGASRGRPDRLLLGVFLLAALVTAVLSLDATVVLLTPIVVGAAATLGTSDRPGAFACLRMANSASLLLPVSNLTNLLALPYLDLDFVGVRGPDGAGAAGRARRGVRRAAAALPPRGCARPDRAGRRRHRAAGPGGARGGRDADAGRLRGALALGRRPGLGLRARPPWCSSAGPAPAGWSGRATWPGPRTRRSPCWCWRSGVVVAAVASGFLGELVGPAAARPRHVVRRAARAGGARHRARRPLLTNLSATILLVPARRARSAPPRCWRRCWASTSAPG